MILYPINTIWNQYFFPECTVNHRFYSKPVQFLSTGSYFIFQSDFINTVSTCISIESDKSKLLVHTCKFLHCSSPSGGVSIYMRNLIDAGLVAVRLCANDLKIESNDVIGCILMLARTSLNTKTILKESSTVGCNSPNSPSVCSTFGNGIADEYNNYSSINGYRHVGPSFFNNGIGSCCKYTIIEENSAYEAICIFCENQTSTFQNVIIANNTAKYDHFSTICTYGKIVLIECLVVGNKGQMMIKTFQNGKYLIYSCQTDDQPYESISDAIQNPIIIDSFSILSNLAKRGNCEVTFGLISLPIHSSKRKILIFMLMHLFYPMKNHEELIDFEKI